MTKSVKIKDGTGALKLKWNGSLSSLQFNNPLSLHWFDCMGSLGKFFVILPHNEEYREQINAKVIKAINSGEKLDENDLNKLIDILQLFENANYEIYYEPSYRYEIDDSWNWEYVGNQRDSSTNPSKFQGLNNSTSEEISKIYSVTESFYDGNNESLLFTQPLEQIDQTRIKHYEELIQKGLRPTAIIYYGLLEESGIYPDGSKWKSKNQSGLYVIDGHHKLIAYKNLNQTPSLIRIVKRYRTKNDFNLTRNDYEKQIKPRLFKPQIKHIDENCQLKNAT